MLIKYNNHLLAINNSVHYDFQFTKLTDKKFCIIIDLQTDIIKIYYNFSNALIFHYNNNDDTIIYCHNNNIKYISTIENNGQYENIIKILIKYYTNLKNLNKVFNIYQKC